MFSVDRRGIFLNVWTASFDNKKYWYHFLEKIYTRSSIFHHSNKCILFYYTLFHKIKLFYKDMRLKNTQTLRTYWGWLGKVKIFLFWILHKIMEIFFSRLMLPLVLCMYKFVLNCFYYHFIYLFLANQGSS